MATAPPASVPAEDTVPAAAASKRTSKFVRELLLAPSAIDGSNVAGSFDGMLLFSPPPPLVAESWLKLSSSMEGGGAISNTQARLPRVSMLLMPAKACFRVMVMLLVVALPPTEEIVRSGGRGRVCIVRFAVSTVICFESRQTALNRSYIARMGK